MGEKMNLRIKTKNHAADSKIGSPLKIDFRADSTHESIPTAWELKNILSDVISIPEAYLFLSSVKKEIKG